MANLVCADDTQRDVHPANGSFTLQELQHLVGGCVQVVPQPSWAQNTVFWQHHIMLVDEDGRGKRLPLNRAASKMSEQVIYGDALVLHWWNGLLVSKISRIPQMDCMNLSEDLPSGLFTRCLPLA